MKNVIVVVLLGLVILSGFSAFPAHSKNNIVLSMCNYIVSDHKSRFRDQLRTNKIKLKSIYLQVNCNGLSLLRFAMKHEAHNVGKFIVKRLPVRLLIAPETDGVTVFDWAKANGKETTPTAVAIAKRAKL